MPQKVPKHTTKEPNTYLPNTQIDENSSDKRAYLRLAKKQARKGLKTHANTHDISDTTYQMSEHDPRHQQMLREEAEAKRVEAEQKEEDGAPKDTGAPASMQDDE